MRDDRNISASNRMSMGNMPPSLSWLGSVVAGEPLIVRPAREGMRSYTDGVVIFIDTLLNEDERRLATIAHALLIAGGSLTVPDFKKLRGRPSVAQRFFALELVRCSMFCESFLPPGFLCALTDYLDFPCPESAEESLQRAFASVGEIPDIDPKWGTIRPFRLSTQLSRKDKGLRSGQSPFERVQEKDIYIHDEDDELDESGSKVLRLFSNPLSAGAIVDYFLKIFGFGRSPSTDHDDADDDGGAMALGSQTLITQENSQSSESFTITDVENLELISEPTEWLYPEWNVHQLKYKYEWVRLSEIPPFTGVNVQQPIEHCALSPQSLKKHLARVGVEFETWRHQPKGDDLDLDRLVEYVIETRQGQPAKDNVYQAGLRTRRDLSVLILLDCSQSTGDELEPGKTVFGQQREIARHICSIFQLFGDRVSLYGFHSWGRHLVRLLRIKLFDERMSMAIHNRLNSLQPSGLTRMGAAIRHATHILENGRYNTHRLILMLTDGFSYDDEYEGRYAEEDTAKALREAVDKGIACVCANVSGEKDDAFLRRLYGPAAYVRCADMTQVPASLRRMMQSAIFVASKAKKTTTRKAA